MNARVILQFWPYRHHDPEWHLHLVHIVASVRDIKTHGHHLYIVCYRVKPPSVLLRIRCLWYCTEITFPARLFQMIWNVQVLCMFSVYFPHEAVLPHFGVGEINRELGTCFFSVEPSGQSEPEPKPKREPRETENPRARGMGMRMTSVLREVCPVLVQIGTWGAEWVQNRCCACWTSVGNCRPCEDLNIMAYTRDSNFRQSGEISSVLSVPRAH